MFSRAKVRWISGALLGLLVPSCGPGAEQPDASAVTAGDGAASAPRDFSPDAPRPVSPLPSAAVSNARPVLRWTLPPGTNSARVEVCADRGCERVEWSADVPGSEAAVAPALAAGVHFWRLREGGAAGADAGQSATWYFRVGRGARDGAVSAWGTVPDYDGDGAPDLVAAGWVYRDAGAGGPEGRLLLFGNAGGALQGEPGVVASVGEPRRGPLVALGDVNGDGFGDLGQAEPSANGGGGEVVARYGRGNEGAAGGSWLQGEPGTRVRGSAGDALGAALSAAGDVDGDGYGDAVASAGRGFVLLRGGPAGLAADGARYDRPEALGERAVAHAVSAAGDLNDDGFADVAVVFADPAGDHSRVFLYWGSAGGLLRTPRDLGTYGGRAAVAAADADGDGCADLAVVQNSTTTGGDARLTVFRGTRDARGVVAGTAVLLPGRGPEEAAVVAGDYDGDGYGDFAVLHGPPAEEAGSVGAGGRLRLAVVCGGAGGASLRQTLAFSPEGAGEFSPERVFGLGDVDADGYSELLVSGRERDGYVVRVYRGSPMGVDERPGATLRWPGNTPGPDHLALTRFAGSE